MGGNLARRSPSKTRAISLRVRFGFCEPMLASNKHAGYQQPRSKDNGPTVDAKPNTNPRKPKGRTWIEVHRRLEQEESAALPDTFERVPFAGDESGVKLAQSLNAVE